MPRWVSILIQVTMTAGQIYNVWGPLVPEEQKIFVAAALGSIQIVVNNIASQYNPDGTKAELPYVKGQQK